MRKNKSFKSMSIFLVIALVLTGTFMLMLPPSAMANGGVAYVMPYFLQTGSWTEPYPIRMAYSTDGLNWTTLNNGDPVIDGFKGRDPAAFKKDDGTFVILATNTDGNIVVIDSPDLCTFSSPRNLHVGPANCVENWAPEAFKDPAGGYVIVFSGRIAGQSHHSLYYVKTNDFYTLTQEATLLYAEGTTDIIDGSIIQNGSNFYLYYKNDDTDELHVVRSTSITGPFSSFMSEPLTTIAINKAAEGPFVIKDLSQNKWMLYYDKFGTNEGFGCMTTTNLDSTTRSGWNLLTAPAQYNTPANCRHASPTAINQTELNKLLSYWTEGYNAYDQFSPSIQGKSGWYYMYYNGSICIDMNFDDRDAMWHGNLPYQLIWKGSDGNIILHPDGGTNQNTLLRWVAPKSGKINISGRVKKNDTGGHDGVNAFIWKGSGIVWPKNGQAQHIEGDDDEGFETNITLDVSAGEYVDFNVNQYGNNFNDATAWNPTIRYEQ